MDTLTEQLERLAELQKKNIEPLQNLGSSAFVAFERMARKNYELMGDMVDYAVAQSRGSIEPSTPQALYERQLAEARAFAERMSTRTAEYVALAEQLRDGVAMPDATAGRKASGSAPAARNATPAGANGAGPKDAETGSSSKAAVAEKRASTANEASASAPSKKTASKKTASKKIAAKKTAARNGTATKKRSASKTAAKKTAARKTPARKTSSKKTSSKKRGASK